MQFTLQPDGTALTNDRILRLACVNVVMENGSEMDRQNPFDKAQKVYDFVTGNVEPQEEQKPKRK